MLPPLSHHERVDLRQAQLLPWIADPFTKHDHKHHHEPVAYTSASEGKAPGDEYVEPLERHISTSSDIIEEHEEIEEATPIELFYDLFFVANLTTVTGVHYITEWRTLSSYMLFFIILWFTWLHVTLLDVRFSVDSVYERICKALHFAVMAAFSSVSTDWDPFSPDDIKSVKALKTMTLTLMFSRFILAFQYFVVLLYGRSKKRVVTPLAIHIVTMVISACVYLGLFWSFAEGQHRKSYFAWYIMAIFEVVLVIFASRALSFRKTHLVERLGLLTLIILGEGIIVMLKAINAIVRGRGWTNSTFGVVAASLCVIYLFWMFYFDYTPKNVHYGTIRQQIWALLHFPFHLSIVLAVEGLRQLTTMRSFTLFVHVVNREIVALESNDPAKLPDYFKNLTNSIYDDGTSKYVMKKYAKIISSIDSLRNSTPQSSKYNTYLQKVETEVFTGLGEYYGIKAPEVKTDDESAKLEAIIGVFDLVFQYFYIALGVIFLMYGIFAIIVRRNIGIFDYVSIGLRFAVSIIFFGMLGLRLVAGSSTAYTNFMWGAWPVPQVCLMIFFVLIIDKIMAYFALQREKRLD